MKPPRISIASHMPSLVENGTSTRGVTGVNVLVFTLLAKRCAEAIRKEYAFDKDVTTVMEYACGTGLGFLCLVNSF